ncbi:MAG: cytochrome c oxidase subunit II [Betaproteobacteria bacterium]|nr:cytochrome c oxidase subunit II [Betaproteobacteria bacterium]
MIRKVAETMAGIGMLFGAAGASWAQSRYNLQPPQSPIATQIYDLHMLVLVICVIIFVGVFSFMFYAIVKHRKSVGHKAAQFHENTTVEIIWTVIPFFILIGMAYPATKTIIAMKDTSTPDMTIKATAYQWKWGYDYLNGEGEGISFFSNLATPKAQIEGSRPKGQSYLLEVDNPVVVPVGRKVRILTTANDVLHAWMVPALGVKQDAIPGFIRDTWFKAEKPGTYRGQCAELCGKDHGFMPIVVEAVEPEKYAQWVAEAKSKQGASVVDPNKQFTLAELMALGEKVFAGNCAVCHLASGKGMPPAFPALNGSKVATGPKDAHVKLVLSGKANTAMASFKQLSDADLAAVVTYERNSWGNKAGDLVQPAEVKALRK